LGGIGWTAVFNFGIPTLFIAFGIAFDQLGKGWTDLTKSIVSNLSSFFEAGAEGPLGGMASGSVSLEDGLVAAGNFGASLLLDLIAGSDALAEYITAVAGESAAEDAAPFVGWIARAIGSAADVASMIETSVEVARSPAVMSLQILRTMDLQVTIEPDPRHQGQWPATATHYEITVTYDDGPTYTYDGQMDPTTQEGSITHTFPNLPAGGSLTVLACFYSDTDWLAGRGTTGPFNAQPNQGSTLVLEPFEIVEQLVPLLSTTTYSLKEKLGFGSQGRIWIAAQDTSPPTATVFDLDHLNVGNNLGALGGFGLYEAASALAYLWEASGQNVPLVNTGTEPYSGQMWTFQVVSDGAVPESGLKFSGYGYTQTPCLALPPSTMANPIANGFLLEPSSTGGMYLRALSLDPSQPPIVSPGTSFGRFTGIQDDLAIHPAGYAVVLCLATCKLQIVKLAPAVTDANAPIATILSGQGTRPGLLSSPVAVTCTLDRVLVLQTTPAYPQGCIVAFDFKGNPVYGFAGNQWSMSLHPEGTANVVLVDLWRTLFTLNYEILQGSSRTEPTVAEWIPSTPKPTTSDSN
ncbi:MAG: hypothetical protein ACRDEA_04375, partial [Microcystaceae cyanobacterium]